MAALKAIDVSTTMEASTKSEKISSFGRNNKKLINYVPGIHFFEKTPQVRVNE
jgi:hypothetical protein